MQKPASTDVDAEPRFAFGKNWTRFQRSINATRIANAERSLREMLGVESLARESFLDIGSGSGLFSLAAARLGAARVHSFDDDPFSVACTEEVKRRFAPENAAWTIERGSVLDREYLARLGRFDVVYAWGVLHHTGAMWDAVGNACDLVADGGTLFIALYNDQGYLSRRWLRVKRLYTRGPRPVKWALLAGVFLAWETWPTFRRLLRFRTPVFIEKMRTYHRDRGMSYWRDLVDWVGGYPFEVATPDAVLDFGQARGFRLAKLRTVCGGHGCNEFVFVKDVGRTP